MRNIFLFVKKNPMFVLLSLVSLALLFFEENAGPQSAKGFNREVMRLEASLKAAGDREKICFCRK